MTRYTIATHTTIIAFIDRVTDRLGADDRGAVTTETAIIVAALSVAAAGLGVVMTDSISNFESVIPSGP